MPQLHHKHPTFHVGRHPNKRVKVKERAYKQVRKLEADLSNTPMPSAVIDLGIDKVSSIIRSVTKDNEDAFQDAWLAIIEDHAGSAEDITQIAKEIYHRHTSQIVAKEHKEISLDEPIGEHRDEGEFTLKDILKSPEPRTDEEIDHDIDADEVYVANSSGKKQNTDRWYLDPDVKVELKRLYPHDILKVAIRKVVGLPPAERSKRGWYRWEDAIIRQRYPWGGSKACLLDICRTPSAINERARFLGIKKTKRSSSKPLPDLLDTRELAEKLGCSHWIVRGLEKRGLIRSIRIPNYHWGCDGVFFAPEDIEEYLANKDSLKSRRTVLEEAKKNKRETERLNKRRIDLQRGFKTLGQAKRIAKVLLQQADSIRQEKHDAHIILHQQQIETNKVARSNTTVANRLARKQEQLRQERRSIRLTQSRLQDYAKQLDGERKRIEVLLQQHNDTRHKELEDALARLGTRKHLVAQMGDKTHYVSLNAEGEIVAACSRTNAISLESLKRWNYNPFVAGMPSCQRCLNFKKIQAIVATTRGY